MNGNCHFIFGTACVTMVALNAGADTTTTTLLITSGLIGSIFPDIDNPNSHMGKLSVPLSTIICKCSSWLGKSGKEHRGIFHDIGIYIVGLVLCYFFFPQMIGFFVGAISHLILDCFNPSGIPFLFGVRNIHLGKIPSGSKRAIVFTWVFTVLVLTCGIVLKLNYDGTPILQSFLRGANYEDTANNINALIQNMGSK